MAEYSNLAAFLKQKRTDANLSRQELAEALDGLHPQFITNWEHGLCSPPAHCFSKLIRALDINTDELVQIMLEDSKVEIETKIFRHKRKAKSTKKSS